MSSKIIYLYVKTHTTTGLKYLGKTNKIDPHKYKGSGKYWNSHLTKHGADYTTEILKECDSAEMVSYWGLYYSELWDVVNAIHSDGSKVWANLKPESGNGGSFKPTLESIAKMIATKTANGTLYANKESIAKMIATKKANGTSKRTPESIAKMVATCHERDSYKRTPESIAKRISTSITNGTNKQTPESIAKMLATRAKNKAEKIVSTIANNDIHYRRNDP